MPIQTNTQLGENVRKVMYEARVSQRDLATRINMSQPGIYRRLAGEVEFSVRDLMLVAEALSVPMEALLVGVDPAAPAAASQVA